jgi:hypothetical protein
VMGYGGPTGITPRMAIGPGTRVVIWRFIILSKYDCGDV